MSNERLNELVESANNSSVRYRCPALSAHQCRIIADWGWNHTIACDSENLVLAEIKNTG